jgi:hypothetical protein
MGIVAAGNRRDRAIRMVLISFRSDTSASRTIWPPDPRRHLVGVTGSPVTLISLPLF